MSGSEGSPVKAVVKWFNATKGFGFVTTTPTTADAFIHVSVLNRAGLQNINDGAEILCTIGPGPKGQQVIKLLDVLSQGGHPVIMPDETTADGPTLDGTVKWFKPDKGFGFVAPDDGSKDVFVHVNLLRRLGISMLNTGQKVQCRIIEANKGREATWITVTAD